jgi:hypothetical protein
VSGVAEFSVVVYDPNFTLDGSFTAYAYKSNGHISVNGGAAGNQLVVEDCDNWPDGVENNTVGWGGGATISGTPP